MRLSKKVFVSQPYLPPLQEFIPYLEEIWESKVLTNNGPMHQQLEKELADYLGVSYVALTNNGMTALELAIKALDLTGEVITTPYSFVATTHALALNNLTPIFVDIDPETLNLDPAKIEAAITDKTTAILPVHCYGNPCDVEAITKIANKYNLKVIYDAAHAFAVKDAGGSIVRYGDLSILSFHATKVFNTFEGGAIICHTEEMRQKLNLLKNFGIKNELEVVSIGTNGKMNEISAAFGLLQLQHLDKVLQQRKEIDDLYREKLKDITGIKLVNFTRQTQHNCAYFPMLITDKYPLTRDELYHKLQEHNIYSRRYFYPIISDIKFYQHPSSNADSLPNAKQIADQVLCLPIYPDFQLKTIKLIVDITRLVK